MPDALRQLPNPKRRLGRYRLIATLGQGGMGTIHLGVAAGIGGFRKLFVIKELKHELTRNEQFLEMFMREARLAARLNHPNVVHTIEADHEDGRYYLAMEFLDGQPFNEVLWSSARDPAPPLSLRLQVLCQALAGLHHAHELRDYDGRALHVVHRDVSPANIFVGYDGQVKVLDFGIAKAADMDEGTRPGEFKGKISYAAPEQLRGLPSDRRVDVFGAGVVLWEALTMRRLVQGKPSRSVFEARLLGTEPRVGQILPELDPALAAICDRAMHTDRDQRYPSAEAFRVALDDYLREREGGLDLPLIARFMHDRFAHARAELHRVIDAELHAQADDPPTGLVSLPALASPSHAIALRAPRGEDDAQAVPANVARLRHKRRVWGRAFGVLAVASLAAAVAARWASEQPEAPGEAHTRQPPAEPSAPAEADPAEADPATAVPGTAASPLPTPAEPAAGPAARTDSIDASTESRAEAPASAADPASASRAPGPRRAPGPPARAASPGPQRREPNARAREESRTPRASARDAAAATPQQPAQIDLHSLPRRQQRQLDLDNPFRK